MIALKFFVADQTYIMQKGSKYCETSAHRENSTIQIKYLNDQIDFLKSEIRSKNAIITMILDDYKNKVGQPKLSDNRRENNTGITDDNHEYQFKTPRKLPKMKRSRHQ